MFRLTFALAAASMIASPVIAAPSVAAVTKDKNGKCHIAAGPKKGAFAKCP